MRTLKLTHDEIELIENALKYTAEKKNKHNYYILFLLINKGKKDV